MTKTWNYYNNVISPLVAPHKIPNIECIRDNTIWSIVKNNKAFIARWTSDFDCGYETDWWYCIKDTPLDIDSLPSKRRYEINKGKKNFDVRIINPIDYTDELFDVAHSAYSVYPEKYRPDINKEGFALSVRQWSDLTFFGAFHKESGKLVGFAYLYDNDEWADFRAQKATPEYEKLALNAALVAAICEYYTPRFGNGFYICDGQRSIYHETAFQDYLEKYFAFRKAYCKLNIAYKTPYGFIIAILMPFRKILYALSKINIIHKIVSILKMEEISRKGKNI